MLRERIIEIYLFLFRVIFNLFRPFSLKKRIVFLSSFGHNNQYVYERMKAMNVEEWEVIFLQKPSCSVDFYQYQQDKNVKILKFETFNLYQMIMSIYYLSTSKRIFIDNYFGFLSAVTFKADVQCVQLWHAAGAIKTFGLKDESVLNRSEIAKKRFLKVYANFDKVVVGSDAFADIFTKAFNLAPENILYTGIPKTDLFFNEKKMTTIRKRLYKENDLLKNKKVILYAPTYRDYELNNFSTKLDIHKMYQELGDEYRLIIKAHPAVKNMQGLQNLYPEFVFDYSYYKDINDLLLITDILISDYSSIPYEFSLLKKPMIFYPYDLDQYTKDRGIWSKYEEMVPGPVYFSTKEIIACIKEGNYNMDQIQKFSSTWNRYSNGQSSENLIKELIL
ncbi:CDP-glycerol glycerophosphotransferase family protein [Bacillus spongiae]|uniref:CDP-glycerol glycerophosphotransferase family protein n=1 Tax=Bacillus spongiae TaxID=2683610 RepID=A0ABU8HEA0_9BACI